VVELGGACAVYPLSLPIPVYPLSCRQLAHEGEVKPHAKERRGNNTDREKVGYAGRSQISRYLPLLVTLHGCYMSTALDLPLRLATPCFLEGYGYRVSEAR